MSVWERIARDNLGLRHDERFIIVTDAALDFPSYAKVVIAPSTGGHGREPHIDVWRAVFGTSAIGHLEMEGIWDRLASKTLRDDDKIRLDEWARSAARLVPAAILAVTHYSTSHTAFRRLLSTAGTRYASMPLFEPDLLRPNGPLDVDQKSLIARTRRLADRLKGAREIHITTPIGTDVHLDVAGRTFQPDDGDLTSPGAFGNLPAGEVYVAPLEGRARGRLAIENDVVVTVENGRAIDVAGDHAITKIFHEHPEYLYVAELGIGTNDKASRTDNVLEAEKILGTVHVAFGDNSSFGGTQQIPYHVDHVLFEPVVTVDGKPL